jgi:hypothetical protein
MTGLRHQSLERRGPCTSAPAQCRMCADTNPFPQSTPPFWPGVPRAWGKSRSNRRHHVTDAVSRISQLTSRHLLYPHADGRPARQARSGVSPPVTSPPLSFSRDLSSIPRAISPTSKGQPAPLTDRVRDRNEQEKGHEPAGTLSSRVRVSTIQRGRSVKHQAGWHRYRDSLDP